jgi:hypothetical protein
MRAIFLAMAATMVVAATTPTIAAARHHQATPSFDTCEALSVERGAAPGQGGSPNPDAQHNAFMQQCLAGEIPLGK